MRVGPAQRSSDKRWLTGHADLREQRRGKQLLAADQRLCFRWKGEVFIVVHENFAELHLDRGDKAIDQSDDGGMLMVAQPGMDRQRQDGDSRGNPLARALARAACLHDKHVSTDRTTHSVRHPRNPCRIATRLDRLG